MIKPTGETLHNLLTEGKTWDEVYKQFPHLQPHSLRAKLSKWRKRKGIAAPEVVRDEVIEGARTSVRVIERDGLIETEVKGERVMTLDDLIRATGVDVALFELVSYQTNSWEQHSVKRGLITLYQVKASWRPVATIDALAVLEDLRAELREESLRVFRDIPAPDLRALDGEYLLELSLPDLHFGKAGDGWNMDAAQEAWEWAIQELCARAGHYDISRVLLPIGNDLFHVDRPQAVTSAGTPMVTVDGAYREHYRRVRAMIRSGVERLLQRFPGASLDVIMVAGNHDRNTVYLLGEALADYYEGHPRVTVWNEERRTYVLHGTSLIGFTHGDLVRAATLPLLMPQEAPDLWACSRFREWHVGHLHRKGETQYTPVLEAGGIRVRVIPSLCAADEWHRERGLQAARGAEAYVWSDSKGPVAVYSVNIG